jgi:hypothetical protein
MTSRTTTRPAPRAAILPFLFLFVLPATLPSQDAPAARLPPAGIQSNLQLERKLLALDLVSYRQARTKEQAAREQVTAAMQRLDQALGGDSLALATLESLFDGLSTARATASTAADQVDWEVRRLQERMRRISFLEGEASGQTLREASVAGRWEVLLSPGNQTGSLNLQLNGTAITGTYALQGGTSGSVRGTVTGTRLQLELLNAAGDLESTWNGGYDPASQRMGGTWLATELAGGQPAQGAWSATRTGAAN